MKGYTPDFESPESETKELNESNLRKSQVSKNNNKPKSGSARGSKLSGKKKLGAVKKKAPSKQSQLLSTIRTNQYDEMIKLLDEMNVKDARIRKLEDEIRTMKTIIFRQDKALGSFEKEHDEVPRVITNLQSELKIAKLEKRKFQDKIQNLEISNSKKLDEISRLKKKCQKYEETVKKLSDGSPSEVMEESLYRNKEEKEALVEKVRELERELSQTVHEKNNEIKEWKGKYLVMNKEFLELKQATNEMAKELHDKELKIAYLEIKNEKRTRNQSRKTEDESVKAPVAKDSPLPKIAEKTGTENQADEEKDEIKPLAFHQDNSKHRTHSNQKTPTIQNKTPRAKAGEMTPVAGRSRQPSHEQSKFPPKTHQSQIPLPQTSIYKPNLFNKTNDAKSPIASKSPKPIPGNFKNDLDSKANKPEVIAEENASTVISQLPQTDVEKTNSLGLTAATLDQKAQGYTPSQETNTNRRRRF